MGPLHAAIDCLDRAIAGLPMNCVVSCRVMCPNEPKKDSGASALPPCLPSSAAVLSASMGRQNSGGKRGIQTAKQWGRKIQAKTYTIRYIHRVPSASTPPTQPSRPAPSINTYTQHTNGQTDRPMCVSLTVGTSLTCTPLKKVARTHDTPLCVGCGAVCVRALRQPHPPPPAPGCCLVLVCLASQDDGLRGVLGAVGLQTSGARQACLLELLLGHSSLTVVYLLHNRLWGSRRLLDGGITVLLLARLLLLLWLLVVQAGDGDGEQPVGVSRCEHALISRAAAVCVTRQLNTPHTHTQQINR